MSWRFACFIPGDRRAWPSSWIAADNAWSSPFTIRCSTTPRRGCPWTTCGASRWCTSMPGGPPGRRSRSRRRERGAFPRCSTATSPRGRCSRGSCPCRLRGVLRCRSARLHRLIRRRRGTRARGRVTRRSCRRDLREGRVRMVREGPPAARARSCRRGRGHARGRRHLPRRVRAGDPRGAAYRRCGTIRLHRGLAQVRPFRRQGRVSDAGRGRCGTRCRGGRLNVERTGLAAGRPRARVSGRERCVP